MQPDEQPEEPHGLFPPPDGAVAEAIRLCDAGEVEEGRKPSVSQEGVTCGWPTPGVGTDEKFVVPGGRGHTDLL